jgi:acetyl-CoA acetyltransferase
VRLRRHSTKKLLSDRRLPTQSVSCGGQPTRERLIHSMRRDGLKRGIVTLCIGGGQGIALALEILS